jgi:hypothetical protein
LRRSSCQNPLVMELVSIRRHTCPNLFED